MSSLISKLDAVVIEPTNHKTITVCVIWLHGLGADGNDFVDMVPQLNLSNSLAIRFIFPHAPIRPVTLNRGYPMRAWYDLYGLKERSQEDESGIKDSQAAVEAIIKQQESEGINASKIILGGFSQGGAMALYTGLRYSQPLGGVIGLSTYLPLGSKLGIEKHSSNQSLPILLTHGTEDEVVPLAFGQKSRDLLLLEGYAVHWKTYPMGHQVCSQEILDVSQWLKKHLLNN